MWERVTVGTDTIWRVEAWAEIPWLRHGFSTRDSGNMALHVGDDSQRVLQNREKLGSFMDGLGLVHWVAGNQVHQRNIAEVTPAHRGRGAKQAGTALPDTDGLFTQSNDVVLASFYADCVPVLFVIRSVGVIGMVHAGWRGTVVQIAGNMVKALVARFRTPPETIQVGIGPSIGPCCYQIGAELAEQFVPEVVFHNTGGTYLDLWEANRRQLVSAGLLAEHIHIASVCTCCDRQFFSFRREKNAAGRMVAFMLKTERNS